jgi:hypothetical protein
VARGSGLGRIAENGHVVGAEFDLGKRMRSRSPAPMRSWGLDHASVFSGFCEEHDSKVFAPVDAADLVPTLEQCALLHYRVSARELTTKRAAYNAQSAVFNPADVPQLFLSPILGIRDCARGYETIGRVVETGAWG